MAADPGPAPRAHTREDHYFHAAGIILAAALGFAARGRLEHRVGPGCCDSRWC